MFGGGIEVPERQVFHEHRAAFDKACVGVDHEAAAVEDEVDLTADLIQVDDRGVNLGGTTLGELRKRVLVLPSSYGEPLMVSNGSMFLVARSATGPPSCQMSSQMATPMVAPSTSRVTERSPAEKDAEFVEHAVVGQEVLIVASPDHALVQDHQSVARLGGLAVEFHGADHHEQIAEAVVVELGGEFVGLVPCGLAEGAAQGQILDGVSGEGSFPGKTTTSGVSCGGFTGVVEHLGGVGVKRADAGVDLGECEAKLCHRFLV